MEISISYTHIKHQFRKENSLSLTEYTFCDMVFFISNNKGNQIKGWCCASKIDIAEEIGLSRQSVHTLIQKMIEKGFIIQEKTKGFLQTTESWDLVYLDKCKETLHGVKNLTVKKLDKSVKKVYTECKETLHNSEIHLIVENKVNKEIKATPNEFGSLFPEESKEKLTLFKNSKVSDFNLFEKQFHQDEFKEVDLNHYFHSVKDWSDQSNKKRTLSGWVATARNWMRRDFENKKLKLKNQVKVGIDQDLMDYLKM